MASTTVRWSARGGVVSGLAIVVTGLVALLAGCRPLPEADSPAARLYADRCGDTCHRAIAPSLLTYEMWKYQLERKKLTMERAGMRPLSAVEERIILDYLKRHAARMDSP